MTHDPPAGWKYYISYCVWLGFEVVFIWFLFPETSNRTLEELAFCKFHIHINGPLLTRMIVYEGDQVKHEQQKRVKEETELTKDQLKTRYVGKVDPKKHLEDVGQQLIEDNIVAVSRQMIDKEATLPKKDGSGGANGVSNGDKMDVEEEL